MFEFASFEPSDILAKLNYEETETIITLEAAQFDEVSLEKLSRPEHHTV